MVNLKTEEEINGIRKSCHLLAALFGELENYISEGKTTKEIDTFCYNFIKKNNAIPAFLNYAGFKGTVCLSVNEAIIHGVPNDKYYIKEGDLVKADLGINLNGYFSDACRSYKIGRVSKEVEDIDNNVKECLNLGIKAASLPHARIFDVSRAIFTHATEAGYGVVKNYCGHGVGLDVHEDPMVPNYIDVRDKNFRLVEGMVLAIEPMITLGKPDNRVLKDGWTAVTLDGKVAAHQEDTVAITHNGLEVLTRI